MERGEGEEGGEDAWLASDEGERACVGLGGSVGAGWRAHRLRGAPPPPPPCAHAHSPAHALTAKVASEAVRKKVQEREAALAAADSAAPLSATQIARLQLQVGGGVCV